MTVIPIYSGLVVETSEVKLPLYAQIIGYQECPFFGVDHTDIGHNCGDIWSLEQRRMLARYLGEAQRTLETQLEYPIGKQWFVEQRRRTSLTAVAKRGHLNQGGIMATAVISAGETVDHTADPAKVGTIDITAFPGLAEDEVHIYHPGTTIDIWPSKVTIDNVAHELDIEIPRCRLVTEAASDNDPSGLDYSDTTNTGPFEQTVDVVRIYNDPSTNVKLVRLGCGTCGGWGCTECSADACLFIYNHDLGLTNVSPARWTGTDWVGRSSSCGCYPRMYLNYEAGYPMTTEEADAIVKLAHSMMPESPCGCDCARKVWLADRRIPEDLSMERELNPFGPSEGAWTAWKFVVLHRLGRGNLTFSRG